ncbi:MAG: FtsW/RodA/SpoVE family cell cycle protein, partial [Clostridium sp.]|nr:FtsW/RodA/SpoVE family cell cycle protein [Clostridium sp.]
MDAARLHTQGKETPRRPQMAKGKKTRSEYYFDYSLLISVFFLLAFGLVMIYSTSSYEARQVHHNAAHFLSRQAIAVAIGLAGMIVIANIDYHVWRPFAQWGILVTVGLLLLLLIPGVGVEVNGATRWLPLLFGFNLQPAEVAKVCVILFMAN